MHQGHDLASALRLVKARRWGVALNRRQVEGLERFALPIKLLPRAIWDPSPP